MKLRESDIFNEFAKICVDKGIIKEAEKHEPAETKSDKISNIQLLYGVKPDSIYKKDLLDEAHPEPVVLYRTHDKLNGLVENLKERQNVMVGISQKPNTGKQTHQVYVKANKELMDQVIKVAMIGAQNNDADLMRFSQLCADRIEKRANPWVIAGVVAGVAAIVGVIASQNYSVQQGLLGDIAQLKVEMEEATSKYPQIGQEVAELMPEIDRLHDLCSAAISLPSPKTRNKKQLAQFGAKLKQSVQFQKSKKAWVEFKQQLELVRGMLPETISSLKEKEQLVSNTDGHWNWVAGLIKMWRKVSPTDIQDAYQKLEDVLTSINEYVPVASKQIMAYEKLENTEIDEEAVANFDEKQALDNPAGPGPMGNPADPGSTSPMKARKK